MKLCLGLRNPAGANSRQRARADTQPERDAMQERAKSCRAQRSAIKTQADEKQRDDERLTGDGGDAVAQRVE